MVTRAFILGALLSTSVSAMAFTRPWNPESMSSAGCQKAKTDGGFGDLKTMVQKASVSGDDEREIATREKFPQDYDRFHDCSGIVRCPYPALDSSGQQIYKDGKLQTKWMRVSSGLFENTNQILTVAHGFQDEITGKPIQGLNLNACKFKTYTSKMEFDLETSDLQRIQNVNVHKHTTLDPIIIRLKGNVHSCSKPFERVKTPPPMVAGDQLTNLTFVQAGMDKDAFTGKHPLAYPSRFFEKKSIGANSYPMVLSDTDATKGASGGFQMLQNPKTREFEVYAVIVKTRVDVAECAGYNLDSKCFTQAVPLTDEIVGKAKEQNPSTSVSRLEETPLQSSSSGASDDSF